MLGSSMSAQNGSMLTEVCREHAATFSTRVHGSVKCRQAYVARHQRHLEPNAVQRNCTRQAKSKACDRTRIKTAASAPDGAAADTSKATIDPAGWVLLVPKTVPRIFLSNSLLLLHTGLSARILLETLG
jgi:hypothetical protein